MEEGVGSELKQHCDKMQLNVIMNHRLNAPPGVHAEWPESNTPHDVTNRCRISLQSFYLQWGKAARCLPWWCFILLSILKGVSGDFIMLDAPSAVSIDFLFGAGRFSLIVLSFVPFSAQCKVAAYLWCAKFRLYCRNGIYCWDAAPRWHLIQFIL